MVLLLAPLPCLQSPSLTMHKMNCVRAAKATEDRVTTYPSQFEALRGTMTGINSPV